ncbi:MAG TPA: sigma-54 dependent transcriptional regulator [Planctomycetota bacterium]|nr:sigma-54 dependent transcriptional regulator [Planctomycetota bacterium]
MMTSKNGEPLRVLYVEDDPTSARLVKMIAEKEGYAVALAASERECMKAIAEDLPGLFLLDLTLPDGSGLDLMSRLKEKHPSIPAIVVTASDSIQDVIGAMQRGAVDYMTKPVDARRMLVSMANALKLSTQQNEIARLRADVSEAYSPEQLVGSSPAMDRVRQHIRRAASSEATVLIFGESGTGKELVARALHAAGPRVAGPFVDVNSAALAETLLESELFGHEKGAFTSAVSRRRGKFEQADGGTIFLDEIGDMPQPTQAKMLRVLQERAFQRVGGDERINVNVRVICATNRNLEDDTRKGTFRKDLFYRINTFVIEIPALRERVTDIPELARHFLARTNRTEKRQVQDISASAMEALCSHPWPGNIRELQHAIERAVLVCDADEILPEHLPPAVIREQAAPPPGGESQGLIEAVERMERSMILAAMDRNSWVKARAARALGVTERILAYKMNNLGIEKPQG